MCLRGQDFYFYIARLKNILIALNPDLFERFVIYGGNNGVSLSLVLQGSRNSPLCEFMLTPHCQLEPILGDPRPSFKQPLLLHSPQLGSLFLSKEPDWGLGSVLWAK